MAELCTGNGPNDPTLSAEHWKNRLSVRDCVSIVKNGGISTDAYETLHGCRVGAREMFTNLSQSITFIVYNG